MEIAGQIGGAIAVGWAIVLAVLLVLFLVGLALVDAIIGTIACFRHMKRSERPYLVWYLVLGILHSILIAASVTLLILLFIPIPVRVRYYSMCEGCGGTAEMTKEEFYGKQ